MTEELINKRSQDIEFIKTHVMEIRNELGERKTEIYEVRPEYVEKIKSLEREKGRRFKNIEEFDAFF
ncbi:MAG: hypothetical protein ACE5KE_03200 [Methanosarcinales archaeon]